MSKVELTLVEDDVWVTADGRLFKEFKYSYRGTKRRLYKTVTIKGKRYDLHKYIALKMIPNPDNKPWVLHYNDDQLDNSIGNLRWGTPKENQNDALMNCRFSKTQMRRKKYKQEIEDSILEMFKAGLKYSDMLEKCPVSISRISQIVRKLKDSGRIANQTKKIHCNNP